MALTVKKNNAVIHISNVITGFERRLYNELLGIAQPDLAGTSRQFQIPVAEILRIMDVDPRNVDYLRQALKAMMDTHIEFNLLGRDNNDWQFVQLFSAAGVSNGTLSWEYPEFIIKQLGRPETYTILSLLEMRQLDSKYTLALYELIKSFEKVGRTGIIEIDTLQKLMGVEYANVKDFFKYVLQPALRELRQKTGWNVEEKKMKKGRSIVGIKFVLAKSAKIAPVSARSSEKQLLEAQNNGTPQEKDYDALALRMPTKELNMIIEKAKARVPKYVLENFAEDTPSYMVSYRVERNKLIDGYYAEHSAPKQQEELLLFSSTS